MYMLDFVLLCLVEYIGQKQSSGWICNQPKNKVHNRCCTCTSKSCKSSTLLLYFDNKTSSDTLIIQSLNLILASSR